jgi:hypothetical protein
MLGGLWRVQRVVVCEGDGCAGNQGGRQWRVLLSGREKRIIRSIWKRRRLGFAWTSDCVMLEGMEGMVVLVSAMVWFPLRLVLKAMSGL